MSDHPVLEVMRIQRDTKGRNVISRYPMRLPPPCETRGNSTKCR